MFPKETLALIVDDMKTGRALMKRCLEGLGYQNILEAQNGTVAFDLISKQYGEGAPIQLILSDLRMPPPLTGSELLRKVRGIKEFKELPFILVTAETDPASIQEVIRLGVSNYLPKTFRPDDLKRILEATWNKRPVEFTVPSAEPTSASFIDEVKEAVSATFTKMLRTEAHSKASFVRGERSLIPAEVAAVAAFRTSQFHGSIILGLSKATYMSLMARYYSADAKKQDFETRDGAAEILNVILGKMKITLTTMDPAMEKTIPSTMPGVQVRALPSFEKRSTVLPYDTEVGPFYVEVMLSPDRRGST